METVLLRDRRGKKILSLSTSVYNSVKESILSALSETGEISFFDLLHRLEQNVSVQFKGDLNWCFLVVKRDLEARGIIKIAISSGRNRAQVISLNKKKNPPLRT